ncbi:Nn.00g053290.m01.CDS01 [Neocucurbitaria sp. VM-36]
MAAEDFIRDLSEYLRSGNLSDLTLNFGEKSWQTHKALACCHSKWFHKAVTSGFEETSSRVITLQDSPEFANAIDCMVSYFYEAGYNASKYDTSEALLHAQVATVADKYDCASLYKLARTSFAKSVMFVEGDDWGDIAATIYDHTTTEIPAHVELRGLVVAAVASRPSVLKTILRNESIGELLRSNADLATDLLLDGVDRPKAENISEQIFLCDNCHYAHVGSRDCLYILSEGSLGFGGVCPRCKKESGRISKRYTHSVNVYLATYCHACGGIHTAPQPQINRQIESQN